MIIPRPIYLQQLIASKGNRMIKVITGIRRCGKSFLLFDIFHEYLVSIGVDEEHIIEVALDDRTNAELRDPDKILDYINSRIKDRYQYYVLLDEVQMIDDFPSVMNSILHMRNVDAYVTGSNSKFLSKDVVTEFRGRGQDIHMYPLSFSEYYSAVGGELSRCWRDYFTYGGLPQTLLLPDAKAKRDYLTHLADTVYIADVVERHKVRNKPELDELLQILASSIGSPCNPLKLSNTFKSLKKVIISNKTISKYLGYFCDAFLIEKALRFNIKGKKYINTLAKYYFTDMGIRNALLEFRQLEQTHLMENIIYNELLYRGYSVDVGVVEAVKKDENGKSVRKQFEVDFVANNSDSRYYIQSAYSIPDEEKMLQETNSFRNINDTFKRVLIVKDDATPYRNDEGILVIGLYDFLLDPDLIIKG
ncbi:MAG: ATP-binding protein [Paramuribaculum sp.]|nr:ATP-binding protein [Paramuribaculum sp.]MDE5835537.1 ATP-binding protein [Paramuribaculum sp.]